MNSLPIIGAVVVMLWSLSGAGYAVMAYTPFTKIQFLDSQVLPATATFAATHGACAWLAVAGVLVALWTVVSRTARVVAGALGAAAALGLTVWPVLPWLDSEPSTLLWSVLFLLPSLVVGTVLLRRMPRSTTDDGDVPQTEVLAAVLAAVVCWAAGFAIAAQRLPLVEMGLRPAMALAAHLVLFGSVAAARVLVLSLVKDPAKRVWLFRLLGAAVAGVVIYGWLFRPINLTGAAGIGVALLFGLTIAVAIPAVRLHPLVALTLVAAVGCVAAVLPPIIAPLDWNFLGQRLVAILAWAAALLTARAALARVPRSQWTVPAVFVLVLVLAGGLRFAQAWSAPMRAAEWATVDPAFAAVLDLAPPRRADADAELFTFLQQHTGLPKATAIAPYEVTFTSTLTPRPVKPPNIFIFVVDSLRQDYVGAYDPAVTFTPSLDRFAADSLVYRRAFSRYGATGLAQPSLWVGGIMPHKQYIQPFAPMNALEKLIRANGYDVRMSYDIISRETVQASTVSVDLDEGIQNMDYRFCATVAKLTESLAARSDRPVFSYTMPQDVHVSTLSREGNQPVDAENYGEKFAPYASRVRRLDTCFGTFIDSLKAMDLYNDSLIVVTSDHGDSLGEGGRWGHAYTVFPEVLRVPLMIKLPWSMQGEWEAGLTDVAFTTDVTPTLYRLLGYDVKSDDRFFGVSLVSKPGERRVRSMLQLGASSYGPVYAVFDKNGESLYILDAVNYRDHLFQLGARSSEDREVAPSAAQQAGYQGFIRTRLTELHHLYGIR